MSELAEVVDFPQTADPGGDDEPLRSVLAERRQAEMLLAGEKRALEMIAASAPLEETLDVINGVIEARSPGALCSILLLDAADRRLRHGSAPSLPQTYVEAIDGVAIGPTTGSCGTAAYLGRQVIVSDIANDPRWVEHRELALAYGLASCWSTPVYSSAQEILGTFAIYFRESRQPTVEDFEIMERMTHLVGIAIERHRAEEAALELSEKLSFQASHDPLTGLLNRYEFERRLRRLLDETRRRKSEHAVCYLDLDQFKIINDSCGHLAGDELLRQLGSLLRHQVRQHDTLARLGGDEFGVVLEDCPLGRAKEIADTLRQTIEDFRFLWEGRSFSLGVSIGLVPVAESRDSLTGILRAADSACYAAKDKGRNRIHVYRVDDAELMRRSGEMRWVNRIRHALEEHRFHLDFQPIVTVNGGGPGGECFELLLRMEDEDGRHIPPASFLPAAERYDLATQLDSWVLASAFDWLTSHPQHLERLALCSVNLSGQSLGKREFLDFIIYELEDKRIPPGKICFEITETAAIANLSHASGFIQALSRLGCRFALDDFGTGFSSFEYLKSLPVDFLKIDGVFVTDVIEDRVDLAVIRSIVEIGKLMGKQTIAECVESQAILAKLGEIGVDYAQGYSIGRPQALESYTSVAPPEAPVPGPQPEPSAWASAEPRQLALPY